jgi:hypothetical protein
MARKDKAAKSREAQVREQCEHRKETLWKAPDRLHFISRCKDIVDYLLPHAGPMLGERDSSGPDARWRNIFDTTATEAWRVAVAGLMTYAFPNGGEWRSLKMRGIPKPEEASAKWLSSFDDAMEDVFEQANTYQGIATLIGDVKGFGQGVAIVDYDEKYTLWLYHVPVGDYALAASSRGQIDTMYRELTMTMRAVVDRWGEEKLCPTSRQIWNNEGSKCWDKPVAIVHAIEPRPKDHRQPVESKGKGEAELSSEMEWRSVYWERDSNKNDGLLSESGYPLFPVLTPREAVLPGSVYGYGSGAMVVSHIRSLQHRQYALGNLSEWESNPGVVLPTAARNQPFGPGEHLYIDVANPHSVAAPVTPGGKADLILAEINDIRRQIKSGMGADVFSMISSLEGGNIRQEHILALREEKLAILGPQTARVMDELPRPLVDIAAAWMQRAGRMPVPPPEVLELNPEFDIELHGPLARASAAAKKLANDQFTFGVMQRIEGGLESARHKINVFEDVNALHESCGADPRMLRSDEEADKLQQAEQQARAAAEQAAMLESMAKSGQALGNTDTSKPNALSDVRQLTQGAA